MSANPETSCKPMHNPKPVAKASHPPASHGGNSLSQAVKAMPKR